MEDINELEARAVAGDRSAFGQLIRRWDDDLRGVVWSVVRDAVATDDVMQASYEKALTSLSGFRGDAALKTWLHSVCWRTAIDHVRRESRRRHDDLTEAVDARSVHSTSGAALQRMELGEVLDGLEPETRSMLMLTAGLGYSYDEVAAMLGVPRGTVASRVGRARRALRAERTPHDPSAVDPIRTEDA